jgi:hypothetical protein
MVPITRTMYARCRGARGAPSTSSMPSSVVIPRKRLSQLLRGPFRSRMSRHREMQDPAPFVSQNHEYVQHPRVDSHRLIVRINARTSLGTAGRPRPTRSRVALKRVVGKPHERVLGVEWELISIFGFQPRNSSTLPRRRAVPIKGVLLGNSIYERFARAPGFPIQHTQLA